MPFRDVPYLEPNIKFEKADVPSGIRGVFRGSGATACLNAIVSFSVAPSWRACFSRRSIQLPVTVSPHTLARNPAKSASMPKISARPSAMKGGAGLGAVEVLHLDVTRRDAGMVNAPLVHCFAFCVTHFWAPLQELKLSCAEWEWPSQLPAVTALQRPRPRLSCGMTKTPWAFAFRSADGKGLRA